MCGRNLIVALTLILVLGLYIPAEAVVLKIATLAPEGHVWMRKMHEGADEVARATDQRVTFKFYPGGVMGNDDAVMRKIRVGQLQGGAFAGGTLSGYTGDAQIYALPLRFKSLEEVYFVRQRMDRMILKALETSGLVAFGLADGGFAYVMSNTPVAEVATLRSLKVWIPAHDNMIAEAMQGFGIHPIPLPIADVRTGLQTGLIDTIANSPAGAIVLQWHTQVKYITQLPFVYIYGILAVDRAAFEKIGPQDQALVHQVMGRIWNELDTLNRAENLEAMEALRKQGLQFIEPSPQQRQDWYQLADAVNRRLTEAGHMSPEMVKTLETLLDEYRSRKSSQGG